MKNSKRGVLFLAKEALQTFQASLNHLQAKTRTIAHSIWILLLFLGHLFAHFICTTTITMLTAGNIRSTEVARALEHAGTPLDATNTSDGEHTIHWTCRPVITLYITGNSTRLAHFSYFLELSSNRPDHYNHISRCCC